MTSMWRPLLLASLLFLHVRLAGNSPDPMANIPEPLDLNGIWRFALASDASEADSYASFHEPGYGSSAFKEIAVPGHWVLQGFEEPHYVNGTALEGFYLRTFRVPEEVGGSRAVLQFGGVWVSAEVWLNGENLGRHDSGFTAFEFDITEELKPGESNTLAVRVRQQIPASLFKFDANDDWGLPGIYRDVRIHFTPKHLYIANVEVTTDLDADFRDASLGLRVMVIRDEKDDYIAPSKPFIVRSRLLTREGAPVQEHAETVRVAGGNNGTEVRFDQWVRSPLLWTAETPNLYQLEVELERDGQVLQQWRDVVGFREISTEGGVLRVNGRAVKLRGVASHDLHPDVGRATTRAHWMRDIALMKEGNINAVRLAHYPHAEGFIRLCDELGLYVIDEIPLGFGGDRMEDPIFAAGMLLRIHETILRDRNRPSVIVWSFGNEDGLTYLHTVGLRTIKGIDPTRPVLMPFRAEPWLPSEVDILAPHYWKAVEYDALGASATRPVVTTEYTHALGEDGVGELEQRWLALTRHPAGAGGMIWLWADQGLFRQTHGRSVAHPMEDKDKYSREGSELVRLSEPTPGTIIDAHGNYGTDGIVTADRQPTRDFLEAKAVYAPVRVMTDFTQVSPGATVVEVPVYNGFDFTDLETVSFRWSAVTEGAVLAEGSESLEGQPNTTVSLRLPLPENQRVDYYDVRVIRSDGSEMAAYSVRLRLPDGQSTAGRGPVPGLVETDQWATVHAGPVRFVFDKGSGQLVQIWKNDKLLVDKVRPVVWRPATYNERNRYDRRENQHDWNTWMDDLTVTLLQSEINEDPQGVEISSTVVYESESLNRFTVRASYRVHLDGRLAVRLRVDPEMDIPEIPEVGLAMALGEPVGELAWSGEGPHSSVPGRMAATRFGHWTFTADDPLAEGTKSGIEWAALKWDSGNLLRVEGMEGVRLEGNDKNEFRVLTRVGGAWTKNGPPENPHWHLSLEGNPAYYGAFELSVE